MLWKTTYNMALLVNIGVVLLALYFLIGMLLGIPFVIAGAQKIDPAAQGAKWRFRLIILPGVCAFWPLLLMRWMRGIKTPPPETNTHRAAAKPL